jgi:hypothetical protein
MKTASTKIHEEAPGIDFIFVILRVARWMIFRRRDNHEKYWKKPYIIRLRVGACR